MFLVSIFYRLHEIALGIEHSCAYKTVVLRVDCKGSGTFVCNNDDTNPEMDIATDRWGRPEFGIVGVVEYGMMKAYEHTEIKSGDLPWPCSCRSRAILGIHNAK